MTPEMFHGGLYFFAGGYSMCTKVNSGLAGKLSGVVCTKILLDFPVLQQIL